MSEHDFQPPNDPSSQASEHAPLSAVFPADTVDFLGQETAQTIAGQAGRLARLDRLAHTPNPFAVHGAAGEIDLRSINPELAAIVIDHKEGRWAERRFDIGGDVSPRKSTRKLAQTVSRLGKAGISLQKRLTVAAIDAEIEITGLEPTIKAFTAPSSEDAEEPSLETAEYAIGALAAAAERLPAAPQIAGLKAVQAAAEQPLSLSAKVLRQKQIDPFSFVWRIVQPTRRRSAEISSMMMRSIQKAKVLESTVQDVRYQGTRDHERLTHFLRARSVGEAIKLLHTISEVKEQIPLPDALDNDQATTALTAEQYLTLVAEHARLILTRSDPGRLGADAELQATVKKARQRQVAAAFSRHTSQEEAAAKQAADEALGGPDLHTVSEVRDILLGGKRLPGTHHKSGLAITANAVALADMARAENGERSLTQEQCGIVMAVTTKRFERFAQALAEMQALPRNNSVDASKRLKLIEEVRDFELDAALVRVRAFLSNGERRRQLGAILGPEEAKRVRKVVIQTIKQRERTRAQPSKTPRGLQKV